MQRKERLTVTVDRALVRASEQAVADGAADSLSAWAKLALSERAAKERRLRALAEAVASYEQECGVISGLDLATQARADRSAAVVVRA